MAGFARMEIKLESINPSSNQAMAPDQLIANTSQLVERTSNTNITITTTTTSSVPTTVRLYTKADISYAVTIRDNRVILAPYNEDDPYQYWLKYRYSTVKDEEGFPSFALVNRLSGIAMKHSSQAMESVDFVPFNPGRVHESMLWTECAQSDGFSYIRTVTNIRLIMDAAKGDKNYQGGEGVHDGTPVLIWNSLTGDNQRWKIVPSDRSCCCS